MTKEKILCFSNFFPPFINGGAEVSTSLILKEISRDFECNVITQEFKRKKRWLWNNIPVYPRIKIIPRDFSSVTGIIKYGLGALIIPWINLFIMINIIRKIKPSIVYYIGVDYFIIPLIISSVLLKKQIVLDVRGGALLCATSFFSIRSELAFKKHNCLKCLSKNIVAKNSIQKILKPIFVIYDYIIFIILRTIFLKFITKRISVIVPNSYYVKKMFESYGVPEKIMKVIYNICDTSGIKEYFPKRENKIVYAGILEKVKGVWDVIQAFQLLRTKNLVLEIAGSGRELKAINEYLISEKLKNVHLLGKISNEQVLELYSKSKIIIAPSIWPEPFGRFILESMATKTPIISTNTGGTPEGIRNMETGILVEPHRPDQIAKAINELLKNNKLYNQIADNLEKEAKKYSPKIIGKQRKNLFEKVIAEKKNNSISKSS